MEFEILYASLMLDIGVILKNKIFLHEWFMRVLIGLSPDKCGYHLKKTYSGSLAVCMSSESLSIWHVWSFLVS